MKRILAWAGGLVLFIVLVVAAVFGAAQTAPGKRWIAGEISRLASDPTIKVTVSGLDGTLPFDSRVKTIIIADADGPFATVTDAALAIAPADLLTGRLTISRLTAHRVSVERQPKTGGGTSGSSDPDKLLTPPLAIELDHVQIDQLSLGAAVFGQPASYAITGAGSLGRGQATIDLDVARSDAPGKLALHAAYGGSPATLHLAGEATEPSGDALASLFHYPDKLPLTADLSGDGPLSDWRGKFAATAGPARIEATLRIAGAEDRHLDLDGSADILALLPPGLKAVAGNRASFTIATILAANGDVTVERFDIGTAAATLASSGHYGAHDETLAGKLSLHAADLSLFGALVEQPIAGAGDLKMNLSGSFATLTEQVDLTLSQARFGDTRIGDASVTLIAKPAGDPRSIKTPIDVTGHGKASGLALNGKVLPGGLSDALTWQLAGRFDRGSGKLDISNLAVDDGGATLRLTGGGVLGETGEAAFAGEVQLGIPDVSRFELPLKRGAVQLTAEVRASADKRVTAVLAGSVERPALGIPPLDGVLGAKANLRGTIDLASDGAVTAQDVELTGDHLRVSASGRRGADGRISADYRIDAPRLQAIDASLAGQAQASGHVAGPPAKLAVTMALDGSVRSGIHQVDRLAAKLNVDDLSKPHALLTASFQADGVDGTASADALLAGDLLHITKASLRAGGAQLDTTATVNIATRRIDGTLDADIPDLKPFSEAAGAPSSGALQLQAKLRSGKGQEAAITLSGKSLASAGVTIETLHLQSDITDVLGRPTGRSDLQIGNLVAGTAMLTTAHLSGVSTQPGRFALTGDLQGSAGAPVALSLAAAAGIDKGAFDVTWTKLSGKAAGTPVQLAAPLHIVWRGGSNIAFNGLSLTLGDGKLTGDGSLAAARPTAHLLAQKLPIAPLLRFAGRPDIDGTLGFELTLAGTRRQPDIHFVIDAERLHVAPASRPNLPALGAVASIDLQGGEARIKGRLAGPKGAAIGFAGTVPIALDLDRLTAGLPPGGARALHLDGDGDLANLADLLPLGEDRLSGRFALDATVGGTVALPTANGKLTIDKAHYVSLATGTDLSGVSLTVSGDRQRLVLQDFSASDGAKGTVTVGGSVDLAASPGPKLDLSATLRNFRALRRDEITATLSGNLHVGGTATNPDVAVKLTVDQADITIPDKLPQSVQPVKVTIIDSKSGKTLSAPAPAKTQAAAFSAGLDVTVTMPDRIFVRGRGLDSEWRGKVSVQGTSAAPDITGSLNSVRGTFSFAGQTLTVNRGILTFPGGTRIDPVVDLQATSQSNDITAIIQVSGTATSPTISLSSEPALPQDEILSRLLFGSSMSQISPAEGIQIAQAAAALAGNGDIGLLDKLRKNFGLDRLSLGSTQSAAGAPGLGVPAFSGQPGVAAPATGLGTTALAPGQTGGSGASGSGLGGTGVSAGKYVANGVYVGVTQGLGSGGSSVNVQVDVTRHISVDTQAGTQAAGTGVGIDWKLDY
jgi:translocation and assembly module TamB